MTNTGSAAGRARVLLDAKIGSSIHLLHERPRLIELLESDEELLDVESGNVDWHGPGAIAITDRRLLFVQFRHFLRRYRVAEYQHSRLDMVEVEELTGRARLIVTYDPHRVVYLLISGSPERARDLQALIAEAAGLSH